MIHKTHRIKLSFKLLSAIAGLLCFTSVHAEEDPAPIVKATDFQYIFGPICKQASFICDGHMVCLSNNGHAKAYPLFSTRDSVVFDLASAIYKPHCNVANLMRVKNKNYLYTTEWSGKRRCFVERIGYDKNNRQWHTELVQTFSFNIPEQIAGGGYADWIVDTDKKKIYLHVYKNNRKENDIISRSIIMMEFNLPKINDGDVTFTEKNILRRTEIPMIRGTQDKEIYKGKMYIIAGNKTTKKFNWEGLRRMVIFDLKTFKVEKIVDISAYFDEPEGLDFWKGTLPDGSKGTHLLITYRKNTFKLTWP